MKQNVRSICYTVLYLSEVSILFFCLYILIIHLTHEHTIIKPALHIASFSNSTIKGMFYPKIQLLVQIHWFFHCPVSTMFQKGCCTKKYRPLEYIHTQWELYITHLASWMYPWNKESNMLEQWPVYKDHPFLCFPWAIILLGSRIEGNLYVQITEHCLKGPFNVYLSNSIRHTDLNVWIS